MKNKIIAIFLGILIISLFISSWGRTAVQTIAGLAVAQSSTLWNNLKDASFGDNATTGIGAFNPYVYDGTNFDRVRGDITNGLDVDVTRVSGNVSVVGTKTPSDAYANPTDAINSFSLLALYNGTTWDRLKTAQITGITTPVTTNIIQNALYGYDNAGASINTYRTLQVFGTALLTINISSNINITTNTDTLIDSGTAGRVIFDKIIIGVAGSASQAVIYNEADGAVPCGGTIIGTITTVTVQSIDLNAYVGNDICITTSGTAAANLIITYTTDVN